MKRIRYTHAIIAGIILLLFASSVSAQLNLVLNIPRQEQHLWGGDFETYYAELDLGDYAVVVDDDTWSLEVRILVSNSSSFSYLLAESGPDGGGDFPSVEFSLSNSATVYIRVEENSVYADSHGFYEVGVYDSEHNPLVTTSQEQFTSPLFLFSGFFIIVVLVIVCIGVSIARKASHETRRQWRHTFRAEPPSFVIPQERRGGVRDGSDFKTVRLPTKCPHCQAALSQEDIDWTGPLEAKCNYCGGIVRATFEGV